MPSTPAHLSDRLFAFGLCILPTRVLSRLAFSIAEIHTPWIKNVLIRAFLRSYSSIDMSEAAEPIPEHYACFNDFFTRELKPGLRPLPEDNTHLLCPVDGQLGAFGTITSGQLCQIKGMVYDLRELVGGSDSMIAAFTGGQYMTFYLAPHDYHRVHMPIAGRLSETRYIPGRLFGVNPRCVRSLPRLFTRNERLISCFDTEIGLVAVIMVGAFIVGGIHTRAAGRICPPHQTAQRYHSYNSHGGTRYSYDRGQQMGHFLLGSSVIVLAGPDTIALAPELAPDQAVRLNQSLGQFVPAMH